MHYISIKLLSCLVHLLKALFYNSIVAVKEGDIIRIRKPDSGIPRCPESLVLLRNKTEPFRILGTVPLQDSGCPVF